jgi:hypothetical protein
MPRFYFDRTNGTNERDDRGTELAGIEAARSHAIRLAGETLQHQPERVEEDDLRIEVSDANRLLLFSVLVITVDSAAGKRKVANG